MLHWALIFLVVALVAAVLGFGGFVVGTALWAAKLCAIIFLVLFLLSLFLGRNYNAPGPGPGPYY